MAERVPVIIIFAPTATGKTAMTLELFGKGSLFNFKYGSEVISCDSQAVYKYFDIGTAKPSPQEQNLVPHHLIDFVDPEIQFGLGEFLPEADRICREILSRRKIPVLCGGTGFYVRNFLLGSPKTPESNPEIRRQIKEKLAALGKRALYAELETIDPASAAKINVNDEYRICRALEVFHTCGKPLSSFSLSAELRKEYDFLTIILSRPREELYRRIDERVEKMFRDGLVSEIENLSKMGYGKDTPAMKAIGYSEFFEGDLSVDQIKEKIKSDSHHYAKKQYAFMRGIPGAHFVDADDIKGISLLVGEFINRQLL